MQQSLREIVRENIEAMTKANVVYGILHEEMEQNPIFTGTKHVEMFEMAMGAYIAAAHYVGGFTHDEMGEICDGVDRERNLINSMKEAGR